MASVLRARDRKHDRDVAVKVLRPGLDPSGICYFVMPLVGGGSLGNRLDRERQLPIEEAVAMTRQLASACGAAPFPTPVIAVLPYLNLSADPYNEYFADGLTEDVIANLSNAHIVRVFASASVMAFKQRTVGIREIADSLNATALVDGSVRRRVECVDRCPIDRRRHGAAALESHLRPRAHRHRRHQTDVALQIASALRTELTSDEQDRMQRPPTTNLDAYELYLRARHHMVQFTKTGLMRAADIFAQATAVDSNFAAAFANAGQVWVELGESGQADPADAYRGRADPSPGNRTRARAGGGTFRARLPQDRVGARLDGAERSFKRALAIQPNQADCLDHYGRLCASLGRFDEVLMMQRLAYELDPLEHRSDIVNAHLRAGQYSQALQLGERLVAKDPQYDCLQATVAWAYHYSDRRDEALAAMRRATVVSPDSSMWLAQLGQMLDVQSHDTEAREILLRLEDAARERYVSLYRFAYVHTGLGEQDVAMDWLERACRERAGAVYGVRGSFLFEGLRTHPRFVALLGRMGLYGEVPARVCGRATRTGMFASVVRRRLARSA
jgi:serine/threonine-protein kinase